MIEPGVNKTSGTIDSMDKHEKEIRSSLAELLEVRPENRDPSWEQKFFHALTLGQLSVISPEAQVGPDGWPYLLASTETSSNESFQKILHWLSNKGIGLVINPQKEYPDYVFTYGMLWHFKETGLFFKDRIVTNTPSQGEGVYQFMVKDIQLCGSPSEAYLPLYVRKIMKEFLAQQGVLAPKILAFSLDGQNFDLAFSKESLGNPDSKEHQGILEALSWFLPLHYQITLVSEKELPWPFAALY